MAQAVPTYYDVLQVDRDATPERIRLAWRKLAQRYHPDKMQDNANASRAMAAINAAYDILSDPHQRALHDRWIAQAQAPSARVPPPRTTPPTLWEQLNPVTGWPWYLLFATMSFAVGTIGTAVYLSAMPARTAAPPPAKATMQPAVDAPARVAAKAPRST